MPILSARLVHETPSIPTSVVRSTQKTQAMVEVVQVSAPAMKWACGVTTVPSRLLTLLPRTLASLKAGGFDRPRLFVDGCDDVDPWRRFELPVTTHWPPIRTFANWTLGLAELYARDPHADRYAMFQDDVVCVRNLRQYLERLPFPPRQYWNLYTFPQNQALASGRSPNSRWYVSNQRGLGALGLVFTQQGVRDLLSHPGMVNKPLMGDDRRWRNLDGGIINAMSLSGYTEMVHDPSLLQHTGAQKTTMADHAPEASTHLHPEALYFPGEGFDALQLDPGPPQPVQLNGQREASTPGRHTNGRHQNHSSVRPGRRL